MEEICRTCKNFLFICANCAQSFKLQTVPSSSPVGSVDTRGEVCVRCGMGGELRLVSRDSYTGAGGRVHVRKVHSVRKI